VAQHAREGSVPTDRDDGLSPPVQDLHEIGREQVLGAVRPVVELRPLASPMPLGFIGLSMATLGVAAVNLGWIPAAQQHQIAVALLAFVVPLQGIACLGAMRGRDPVAATAMGVLAATWAVAGLVLLGAAPDSTSEGLGVVFLLAALAMTLPAVGALFSKVVVALVLFGAVLRFASSGVYQLTGNDAWKAATGWIGVALGVLAIYAAFATLLEGVTSKTVLPLGRHGRGQSAITGGLAEQTLTLANEPGVRQQL
jgi:uncharacterized protein